MNASFRKLQYPTQGQLCYDFIGWRQLFRSPKPKVLANKTAHLSLNQCDISSHIFALFFSTTKRSSDTKVPLSLSKKVFVHKG